MQRPTFCLIVPWMALGGADRCGLDLLRLYSNLGYRTILIATSHHEHWHKKRAEFAAVVDEIYTDNQWLGFLQKEQPQIVVINNSHHAYQQIDLIRAILPHCHISCLMHMMLPFPWDFENWIKKFQPIIDSVITISFRLKRELVSAGVSEGLIIPVHWFGFDDTSEIDSGRKVGSVILCPFRLQHQKRPTFVADIASAFKKLGKSAIFRFVGSGDEECRIKYRAEQLGVLDLLEFSGCQDFTAMPQFYAQAAVLLCPSLDEGIPLTYYEAIQCRIPLAVSNVGAVSEVVPRKYLIERNSDQESLQYAHLLFRHLNQPDKRTIRNAQRRVQRLFSKSVWAAKIERIFR